MTAPVSDERPDPDERIVADSRDAGLELRTARGGEWITCANPIQNSR